MAEIGGLNRLVDSWSLSDRDFRDRQLQRTKVSLLTSARILAEAIAIRTRPFDEHHLTVKLANTDERTEGVREDARVINKAARDFSSASQRFVRTGRQRLTIV